MQGVGAWGGGGGGKKKTSRIDNIPAAQKQFDQGLHCLPLRHHIWFKVVICGKYKNLNKITEFNQSP